LEIGLCEKKNIDNGKETCYIKHVPTIQKKLRDLIIKKNVSIYQVAQRIGVDHANLYRSLADGSNLELNTMMKVLSFLGYEVRFVKSKARIGSRMEKSNWRFGENLSKPTHDNLRKLFESRKGAEFSAAAIRKLYEANYSSPDVMWVQASDHAVNMTNKGACWCAKTDEAIFEQIKHGLYRVR
jgi:transcriptional regulator with XRE-family HTH domain